MVRTERRGRLLYDRSDAGGMAVFSENRLHRYFLLRPVADNGKTGPAVCFGMQNPSKAGAEESDPTIARCIGFAKRLGARLLTVVNMGAGIATDPDDFIAMADPLGPDNIAQIEEAVCLSDIMIAGWGALDKERRALFGPSIAAFTHRKPVKCLGKTRFGDPRHPLYLAAKTELVDWIPV